MTRLLVSVRDLDEARLIADCGVGILDIKEPRRGPLGRAAADQVRDIVSFIDRRVPVSVALGELVDLEPDDSNLPHGISYVKVGLAQAAGLPNWRTTWKRSLESFPASAARVAVAYADWQTANSPSPLEVLDHAVGARCSVFLIDTYSKTNGTLFAFFDLEGLDRLIAEAHLRGIAVALAGSLGKDEVAALLPLEPDLIAVRGAVCGQGRDTRIDARRTRELVRFIESGSRGA
jgi:uncharacterized protein (UPF0264 family)